MFIEGIIGLFLAVTIWLYYTNGEDPLAKMPGPPRLPIIGNAHQVMRIHSDNVLETVREYTIACGDRIHFRMMGLRALLVTRPSDVEVVLSHSKNITKGKPYVFLKNWLGSGLLLSTGDQWHTRRKILTPTFHFNILKNFAIVMEERSKELVNQLKETKGADVDVMPVISDYTLFVICETAMGTKLDKDQSAATVEYKNAIEIIGNYFVNRCVKVWLWADFVYRHTSAGKDYCRLLDTVQSFVENVIRNRKAQRIERKIEEATVDEDLGTKKRLAMLDLLLEAEAKGEIDMAGITDEVNTFMLGGYDTTAIAITFGLMLLAEHEDIQEHIFWELQGILNNSDRYPSLSDLADMKYMEAVIKEVLRLYPSVPAIGRVIDEDFMLDDVLVKRGTHVGVHFYELHRREDMFPDAQAFKPERFLPGSELKHPFSYVPFSAGPRNCIDDVLVKRGTHVGVHFYELHRREDMFPDAQAFKPERFLPGSELKHPFSYVPFSAGPRNCIGQRFAMQEMKSTFCEIIRNFKLVPKVKGARPKLTSDLVLRPVDPIYIKFMPRK